MGNKGGGIEGEVLSERQTRGKSKNCKNSTLHLINLLKGTDDRSWKVLAKPFHLCPFISFSNCWDSDSEITVIQKEISITLTYTLGALSGTQDGVQTFL